MNTLNTVDQANDTYNLDTTTHSDLHNHVYSIAESLTKGIIDCEPMDEGEEPSAFDWLQDALDIQYIVSGDRKYIGARILVAFGGPNIWVNTQSNTVEGAWYMDKADAPFVDNIGIDDALEELWACS